MAAGRTKTGWHAPALLVFVSLTAGCASIPKDERPESDPWEPLNRSLYKVHEVIDGATLKPVAKGYNKVLPQPVRTGVSNFFRNLSSPRSILANFLQGKPSAGFSETVRLVVNSTLGVGGLFDVAAAAGLAAQTEDFDQTAAVWGVPDGPYVMLPILGPQTLRSALLIPLEIYATPLYHYDVSSVRDRLYVLRAIELRARLLPLEDLLQDSKDPYVTLRESYLQNARFEIYDGNPPTEDYDLYEEFLDEEGY